jgi:hypothetical protein
VKGHAPGHVAATHTPKDRKNDGFGRVRAKNSGNHYFGTRFDRGLRVIMGHQKERCHG